MDEDIGCGKRQVWLIKINEVAYGFPKMVCINTSKGLLDYHSGQLLFEQWPEEINSGITTASLVDLDRIGIPVNGSRSEVVLEVSTFISEGKLTDNAWQSGRVDVFSERRARRKINSWTGRDFVS